MWDKPLFIIGNPRSGTSMLRLMLSTHSKIMIAPESGFLVWWCNKYKDWNIDWNKSMLDEFITDLFDSRRFEFWNMSKQDLKDYILKKQPANYAKLNYLIYLKYATNLDKGDIKIWGDKNNHYLNHIDELDLLYPNASFIHIIRDGRDVATSYKKLSKIKDSAKLAPNLADEISDVAIQWRDNIQTICESLKKIDQNRVAEVRYEDLVLDPVKNLKMLCNFLDVEYEFNMINFHEYNRNKDLEPKEYLAWKAETFQKLNSNAIQRYKVALTTEEINIFNSIAESELIFYNYTS